MATTYVFPAGVQINNTNGCLIKGIVGDGSEISYPHGLGVTPSFVVVSPVDSELADYIQGTHDQTNIKLQVANLQVVDVFAWVMRS